MGTRGPDDHAIRGVDGTDHPQAIRATRRAEKLAGFGVRISGKSKTFVFMVRVGGRKRRVTLGRFPDTTLAEARAKAHAIRGGTADGGNPEDFVAAAAKSWRFSDGQSNSV